MHVTNHHQSDLLLPQMLASLGNEYPFLAKSTQDVQ